MKEQRNRKVAPRVFKVHFIESKNKKKIYHMTYPSLYCPVP